MSVENEQVRREGKSASLPASAPASDLDNVIRCSEFPNQEDSDFEEGFANRCFAWENKFAHNFVLIELPSLHLVVFFLDQSKS